MDIKIKKLGWNTGTCGWLAAQLASTRAPRAWIEETTTNNGKKLALIIRYCDGAGKITSMLIAIYNPYNLSDCDGAGQQEIYRPLRTDNNHCDLGSISDTIGFTPAARETLHTIASNWCEERNEERNEEKPLAVHVTFS